MKTIDTGALNFIKNLSVAILEDNKLTLQPTARSLSSSIHGENFMAIFTILSVVTGFSTSTLGILATLVSVFTIRMGVCDTLDIAIIPTPWTSILF